MHKVKSTYKVLADKVLQQDTIEEWKDWSLEMMLAGFESEHLIILAGLTPPMNRFEFSEIVNKALKELSLDTATPDEIIYGYVYFLIIEAINSNLSTKEVLITLRELCRDRNYEDALYPFYCLAYAQEELEELGVQYYWEGAGNDNFDSIVNSVFQEWKNKWEHPG